MKYQATILKEKALLEKVAELRNANLLAKLVDSFQIARSRRDQNEDDFLTCLVFGYLDMNLY